MFVRVEVFALIVGLLCACIVRRFRGLKRVSPLFYLFRLCFISFASVFLLLRLSFVLFLVLLLLCLPFFLPLCSCFYLFSCFPWLVLLAAWLLLLVLSSLSLWVVVVSFSLSVYTQKERALRVGASSLVLLWVCISLSDLFNILGII